MVSREPGMNVLKLEKGASKQVAMQKERKI